MEPSLRFIWRLLYLLKRKFSSKNGISLPFCNANETRNDNSWRDSSKNEAQHETDGDGEAHDEVAEASHGGGLHEAGDEGGSEDHPTEVPKCYRVHF